MRDSSKSSVVWQRTGGGKNSYAAQGPDYTHSPQPHNPKNPRPKGGAGGGSGGTVGGGRSGGSGAGLAGGSRPTVKRKKPGVVTPKKKPPTYTHSPQPANPKNPRGTTPPKKKPPTYTHSPQPAKPRPPLSKPMKAKRTSLRG